MREHNRILASLSKDTHALLQPQLHDVTLAARDRLEVPGRNIEHAYFIESGIAATVAASGRKQIAVGLIGCEGATGIPVFLGSVRSPNSTVMIAEGRARRIDAEELTDILMRLPELKALLLRYCAAFFAQAAQTALSNATSLIEQRVARWMLMTSDRFSERNIPLTHDTISFLLGIRRAGVTVAIDRMAHLGLLEIGRGWINILDRSGIEEIAGSDYGGPEREFARLIGRKP
jgi:CRP-like cAMP-binding protein